MSCRRQIEESRSASPDGGDAGEATSAPSSHTKRRKAEKEEEEGGACRAHLRRKKAAAVSAQLSEWLNESAATMHKVTGVPMDHTWQTAWQFAHSSGGGGGGASTGHGPNGPAFHSAQLQQGFAESWGIIREEAARIEEQWRAKELPRLQRRAPALWRHLRHFSLDSLKQDLHMFNRQLHQACNKLAETHAADVAAFRRNAKTYCRSIEVGCGASSQLPAAEGLHRHHRL